MFGQLNRGFSGVFKVMWLLYIVVTMGDTSAKFTGGSLLAFICLTGLSKLSCKVNLCLSIMSILTYSCFIDIICYFILPTSYSMSQPLSQYVIDGLLFNSKHLLFNLIIFTFYFMFSRVRFVKLLKLKEFKWSKIPLCSTNKMYQEAVSTKVIV